MMGGLPGPTITVVGDVDARAVEQLQTCVTAGDALAGGLCADGHVGYSQPVGGYVAYRDFISPSGVGYDIGCGNKAVQTNLRATHIAKDLPKLMDSIADRISFGIGRKNNEAVDHPVLDAIRDASFIPQRRLAQSAAAQLGTVGSGNHYVDLFRDDEGFVWVGVHFGSRGFGHKTASGFLAMAQGLGFDERAAEGEMFSPPILFHTDTGIGQSYIEAMSLAGDYAYAGRDVVCDKALEILGAREVRSVHNHHNFAWRETHFGEDVWVVRKGCTPAFPGQLGFVGATMGEQSVILAGVDSPQSQSLLASTVHGAGRVMSRTRAAGKSRKRWVCNTRDCEWFQGPGEHKPTDGRCPRCRNDKLSKRMIQLVPGEIDWDAARQMMRDSGIELRGAGADEAPGAYKRLDVVLGFHAESVEVQTRLTPIGVVMAGADTFDPFKD